MPEKKLYTQGEITDIRSKLLIKTGEYTLLPGIGLEDIGHFPFVSIGILNDAANALTVIGVSSLALGGLLAFFVKHYD
jgi:hypothetical protein